MHYRIYDNIHEQHKDQIRAAGLVLAVTIGLPILSALLNQTYVHYPWPWGSGNNNGSQASVVSANPASGTGGNGSTPAGAPNNSGTATKSGNPLPNWMSGASAAAYMAPLPPVGGKGGGPVESTANTIPAAPCPPTNTSSKNPTPIITTTPVTSPITNTVDQVTNTVTKPVTQQAPAPSSSTNSGSSGGATPTPLPLAVPSPVTSPIVSQPAGTTSVTSPVSSTSASTKNTNTTLNANVGGVQTQLNANPSQPSLNVKLGL